MAFTFFGVYFQAEDNTEYHCGFYDDNYQPIIEKRENNNWVEVSQKQGTGAANATCRDIRDNLPIRIPFPPAHTQNERMELINQIIYNINRHVTERVNYRGAFG